MSPDSSPVTPPAGRAPGTPPANHRRLTHGRRGTGGHLRVALTSLVTIALLAGAALLWTQRQPADKADPPDAPPAGQPTGATPTDDGRTPTEDIAAARVQAVIDILEKRAQAVHDDDPAAWQSLIDPAATDFAERQANVIDRLADVPFAEWTYELVGDGPGLPDERAAVLPEGSAIVRVRLTYRIEDTENRTDRDQYFTVVPRGGRWLLAGDTDASPSGLHTQRDLWDLGPVRLVRGERATVLGDRRGASREEMARLAQEADDAVEAVNEVWRRDWPQRPVVILPRSQQDMATLIADRGEGIAQIAAVTTGAFEEGLSRGDRVVVNPGAFDTLGALGRAVVLSHEMTHVATRASSVVGPPIWLSEGFADYVAYSAVDVPTTIVAADVIDDVRDGNVPRRLPERRDFDAGEGDIAAAYEGAWLACRMLAERYGEKALVRFYVAMSDGEGPGWPSESEPAIGLTAQELTRQWRSYLRRIAA